MRKMFVTYLFSTLKMSCSSISAVEALNPDELAHKLGYPDRPVVDKEEEIKASMREIKSWLDDDATSASLTTKSSSRRRAGSSVCFKCEPAVLIASTGSICKKRQTMAARPPLHLIPGNNAEHLASVKYEPRSVAARPKGLESFPRLACPPSPPPKEGDEIVRVQRKLDSSQQQGIVGKLKYFFGEGGEDMQLVYQTANFCI
jgi:hypothetical protein